MAKYNENNEICCSFCGKPQSQVNRLVSGPEVYICDECIALCNDILREKAPGEEDDSPLYILTNEQKCFGAVCIGYPDMTEKIASEIGGDYYIIPSSIHECLILGAEDCYRPETLNRMVRDINRSQLEPSEILSDHVYYYDAERRVVEAAVERREEEAGNM